MVHAVLEEDTAGGLPEQDITPLLAELADADPTRVAGWLTAMTNLGLLTPGPDGCPHYPHPLLRDAILSGVPGSRRRAAHRAIAEALLHQDAPAAGVEPTEALIALGRRLIAAGEAVRARDCLREAVEQAERLGAVRLVELAERTLRKGGARSPRRRTGAASLTGGERRIAELAAEGRTNGEIAALLHLTRRTVETHLTHTYKKLGIRRRADPPPALEQGA